MPVPSPTAGPRAPASRHSWGLCDRRTSSTANEREERSRTIYYELRQYTTTVESAVEFQANFGDELLPVLAESGFDLVGAWTIEIGDGSSADLLWLLRWQSLEAREAAYRTVRSDPRNAAFRERNAAFLVSTTSQLLKPASFSPLT
ncbi:MAG: NIPSNAP family protein [Acidimicrobiia bacterium]|nr:NIPSNAP family protein [Acidimicrobiia bacterium]